VAADSVQIGARWVGTAHPTYFIADVGANHDGSLDRAKLLIRLASRAGADAVKFQHFAASTIVSDVGFRELGGQLSHQAAWKQSVFEVYQAASLDQTWTADLRSTCLEEGVEFFTSPYSFDLVDAVDPYVPAYKVGSGDITWHEILLHIGRKGKPVLLATGASSLDEVCNAVDALLSVNPAVVLMQCNTNYTGSDANLEHIHLNVLRTYHQLYPGLVLGLSDHTNGHVSVLGAVALGARVIEKHFTDDTSRVGPDHGFAMDPQSWADMVTATRQLESALGSSVKRVAANEMDTVVVQRRAVRARRDLGTGTTLAASDIEVLRPCPRDAIPASEIGALPGRRMTRSIQKGQHLRWNDLE